MTYLEWAVITIIVAIMLPVIFLMAKGILQKRDGEKQLEGKENFRDLTVDPEQQKYRGENDFDVVKSRRPL